MKTEQEIRDKMEKCLRVFNRETKSEYRAEINLARAMILQWVLDITGDEMNDLFSQIQKEDKEG